MSKQNAALDLGLARLVKKTRAAYAGLFQAEKHVLGAQQAAAARRLELGLLLMEARPHWPARGPKARGWGEHLTACGLTQDIAWMAMKYAGFVEEISRDSHETPSKLPTLAEAGLEKPAPFDRADGGDPIDRDTWCTPSWIAESIGVWDLDPCANDRSIIQAERSLRLERGEDGLALAEEVGPGARVFINPPYSDVGPWIKAYAHTRFCFLLKLDVSTKWFERLFSLTDVILLPRRTRVEFTPPPGVPPEKANAQPFPHALFYAREDDAAPAIRERCFPAWRTRDA